MKISLYISLFFLFVQSSVLAQNIQDAQSPSSHPHAIDISLARETGSPDGLYKNLTTPSPSASLLEIMVQAEFSKQENSVKHSISEDFNTIGMNFSTSNSKNILNHITMSEENKKSVEEVSPQRSEKFREIYESLKNF